MILVELITVIVRVESNILTMAEWVRQKIAVQVVHFKEC